MKPEPMQQAILVMHAQGMFIREISRKLKISRKVVRRVLRQGVMTQRQKQETSKVDPDLIRKLFNRCKGNVVRVQEVMEKEYGEPAAYSTLTRLVREDLLREAKPRAGSYSFGPGEEMEHDTSPHRIRIGEKTVTAQCAALIYAYSRQLFIQYFPRFTRFEAKCFLHQGLSFMEGACDRCVIDNTSVLLAGGSGANAVIAPEMEAFARLYEFEFFAHAIGNPNRKPHVERAFHYGENNFLPGRTFSDWTDLNKQAVAWCCEVANAKVKRSLAMSPQTAWLMEKPFLNPLPAHPIPLYQALARVVDNSGFVNLDTNRYSVPDRLLGKLLEVHKHLDRVRVYHGHRLVADHPRLIDQRGAKITAPSHHSPLIRKQGANIACEQELKLKDYHPDLDIYIAELKKRVRGRGVAKFQRLLSFKRTYPSDAFLAAVREALHYCLYDLNRLENMILQRIAGDFFQFDLGGDWPCD